MLIQAHEEGPLNQIQPQRKLATIVSVDIAGYSARAETDQDAAAAEVAALGRQIEALCARFDGRLFNSAGDGFMLEFSTVSQALEAAEALAASAASPVRIGVHLGEVRVAEDGDLLGHGVNVAARIQALAAPRTVLASGDVKRAIRGPLADRLRPRGAARLDKMSETVALYVLAASAPLAFGRGQIGRPRRALLAGGAAAMLAAGAGSYALMRRRPKPKGNPLIAVLPFDNLSPDPQLGYLADGLSEDILDALLRGGGLRVTARSSSFRFRGGDKAKAGEALKADYLLDGSVLKDGPRLRVTARLSGVGDDQTLWSQSYDRDFDAQLKVEDEIAGQVAAALRVRFSPTARTLIDPAAYDLYQRGRAASRLHTPESIRQGQNLLRQAVQLAPDFPQAWFELANSYSRGGLLQPLAEQERAYALGLDAAVRARTLDPDYGAAWAIDAVLTPFWGRWAVIQASLDRGAKLSPHDPDVLLWRSYFLQSTGRNSDSVQLVMEARELNPLDTFPAGVLVQALTYAERFSEAEQASDHLQALFPKSVGAYWYRTWLLITARRYDEAIAWLNNDAVKPPDKLPDEFDVLRRAVLSMAHGDQKARREAAEACVGLARFGTGYAGNSLVLLGGLAQWDMARDLARGLYLKAGPMVIDRSVQFVGESRYQPFDQPTTSQLFHPFLKPMRASGGLEEVFGAIGLTAYWKVVGRPPS